MLRNSVFKTYSGLIGLISRFSDPVSVLLAAYVAYGLRFSFEGIEFSRDYLFLISFAVLSVIIVFPLFNLYVSWRGQSLLKQAKMVFWAWCTVVVIMILLLFVLKISAVYSRIWLGSWAAVGLVFILTGRIVIYSILQYQRKRRKNIRNVLIVGAGQLGCRVQEQLELSPWTGYVVDGFFDDDPELRMQYVNGVQVKGGIDEVEAYVATHDIDELWLALPLRAEQRMKKLLYGLRHYTLNIKLIPDIFGFSILNHSMTEIAGLPAVNLSDTPMGGANRIIKELEDRILAFAILLLISPVALFVAIAVKITSPGPLLFKQKRHGWDGRIINIYKFRTMIVHGEDNGVVTQASKNDPRLTRIGGFLRKTSLDELPQFYNVLQGRMSIVGPRPHALQHNEQYKEKVDRYMLRHMVKPGITGWAQINGYRGETDTIDKMKKRIEYDLYYIENWSLWFDLKIIGLTLLKGFFHRNAY